jgi:hypothetical protein
MYISGKTCNAPRPSWKPSFNSAIEPDLHTHRTVKKRLGRRSLLTQRVDLGTRYHLEDMQDILPEPVLQSLTEHYYAGVTAAEIGYQYNSADEDSVTGSLGQALLVAGERRIQVGEEVWGWRAYHHKLRGRGPGAPEKTIGADGIFQLEVFDRDARLLRKKGLLFQSKINWRGSDQRLLDQATLLAHYSSSAIVVDYRGDGFKAVPALHVAETGGNRRAVHLGSETRLAVILGDDFVRCRRGDIGMSWDPRTERLETDSSGLQPLGVEHVMGTTVQRLRV